MEWNIGNIKIKNQIVTAPMAGLTDYAFRHIIEEYGAGLVYTEMISAEAIVRDNKKTLDMLVGIEDLKIPIAIQLFGGNAAVLAIAARYICKIYPISIIDINMGCPVPKVAVRAQAGSSLLKNPEKIYEIVKAVVEAVPIPVTVKIRSGWDSNTINAVEIAKTIEKAGGAAIAIHGRTRAQGYGGKADWGIIKAVKEAVSIPVIGNGDITSCYEAERMLKETGCDGVMIGRAILGNPWLIKECVDYLEDGTLPKVVSYEEKIDMIKRHFELLLATKPEKVALLEMRSHAAWYLKGIPGGSVLKGKIHKCKDVENFKKLLNEFKGVDEDASSIG